MARLPRFVLPGFPQHVIQRGNNHQAILRDEEDYWFLWGRLRDAAAKFQCEIHAYVLMPDHFHLLLTPWQQDGIGKLMQYTGRYFVQHVNGRYQRKGTLWEGRYRATLLDPQACLLPVSRYIETNAVRTELVSTAEDYDWSSYAANALGVEDELAIPHPVYRALGDNLSQQQQAYRALFEYPLSQKLVDRIRAATNKAWVLGDERFCQAIEDKLNRRAKPRPRGGDRRSAAYRRALEQPATLH
ncbi:MAG: transposase [Lamprobacter sp.]|uniref:transposase n=1 Tax=Lamprobacter sp. TaxID=3100796 RepID=UPI002B2600FF|nr:transposase [Lamprobacter sp.]MEA3639238.1 transposase [Lamprobacter sp.]